MIPLHILHAAINWSTRTDPTAMEFRNAGVEFRNVTKGFRRFEGPVSLLPMLHLVLLRSIKTTYKGNVHFLFFFCLFMCR
jgi:hypothetical protein